jgi:hypothetical protein
MVVAHLKVIEPEDPIMLRQRIREACRRQLADWKVPAKVLLASETMSSGRFKKMRAQGIRQV